MASAGDTKERFGRSYIYLIPTGNEFDIGTWRLRVDDNGTVPPDGPDGPGGDGDLSFEAVVAADETAMNIGQLIYLDSLGQARKASASALSTSQVAGMVVTPGNPGEACKFTRNEIAEIFNTALYVDGGPALLTPGATYYLSTTPGNWTTTPDTTTPGAVVRSCGLAIDGSRMSIEVQNETVI